MTKLRAVFLDADINMDGMVSPVHACELRVALIIMASTWMKW